MEQDPHIYMNSHELVSLYISYWRFHSLTVWVQKRNKKNSYYLHSLINF